MTAKRGKGRGGARAARPRLIWTEDKCLHLIRIRGTRQWDVEFQASPQGGVGRIWERVAKEYQRAHVNDLGENVSFEEGPKELQTKWANLKQDYRVSLCSYV